MTKDTTPPGVFTDTGNGERFASTFGDRFCFTDTGTWLHFNGSCWISKNARDFALEHAKKVARSIGDESDASAKEWSRRSLSRSRLENMIECARTQLIRDVAEFDAERRAVNVKNGVIRFAPDGHFRFDAHKSSDMMRQIANAAYDPDAKAPVWKRHLERVQPNPEMRDYLQRVLGYAMLGDPREHALFIARGAGGDGKTTTMSAVAHVLGSYSTPIDIARLLEARTLPNAEAASPMLASLEGDMRLVTTAEPPLGAHLNESLIKTLTGGGTLKVRRAFENCITFRPRFVLTLECNALPRVVGSDEGIWRRLRVIPFNTQIPRSKMDVELTTKLEHEASGILNWLIEGAQNYLKHGLDEPAEAVQATRAYRANSLTVPAWSEQCLKPDSIALTPQKDLWTSYQGFCRDHALRVLRRGAFLRQLEALGLTKEAALHPRTRQVMWSGMTLKMK